MAAVKHIAILCSYLNVPGGYEKAVVTLANLFIKKGNHVTLIILDHAKEIFYPLDPAVQVIQQQLSFGIAEDGNIVSRKVKLLGDVLKLRKIIKGVQPTHLIATEYPFAVAAVLSGEGRKTKMYSWEHHHFGAMTKSSFWNFASNRAFHRLDGVVSLNADERDHYIRFNKNTVIIPNFIEPPAILFPYEQNKKTEILTVTRFNHIKGIDLFQTVARTVLQENPDITWKVIGYGPQEEELRQFISAENLDRQLIIQHAADVDITAEYQQASLFVMTSRNECFPLVLLEAMNNGLPCIAFDCDTGPRHIIRHNKTGLLIAKENTAEMALAVDALITDQERRKKMSANALHTVEQYYPEPVYEQWEKLLGQ